MKTLENRALDSKREMDNMAALDELKSMQSRHTRVIVEDMMAARFPTASQKEMEEQDKAVLKSVVFQNSSKFVRRIDDNELEEDGDDYFDEESPPHRAKTSEGGDFAKRQKIEAELHAPKESSGLRADKVSRLKKAVGYGQIKFLGETDVRRLDLENIVQFNKCEVLVYIDETKKPAVGQGLNKASEMTLLNVKCVDKKMGQHHAEGPEVEKFQIAALPDEIGELTSLTWLCLNDCNRLRVLPEALGKLSSLVRLECDMLALREIPKTLGDLSKLKYLSFGACHYMTKLPAEFAKLKSLISLWCVNSASLKVVPPELDELAATGSLRVFNVYDTGVRWEHLPENLCALPKPFDGTIKDREADSTAENLDGPYWRHRRGMLVDTISLCDPSNKDERAEEDGGAGGGVPGFLLWMELLISKVQFTKS